jgi:hypothetical protein
MDVKIDTRVELLTIIQTLCNYWDDLSIKFTNNRLFNSPYKNKLVNYFEKYKTHNTIELYNRLCDDVPDISAFISMVLCYSDPPELRKIASFYETYEIINASHFPEIEFIDSLREFYDDTKFDMFMKNNQGELKNLLNDFRGTEKIKRWAKTVFNYFDIKNDTYTVIISALIIGNFGIKIKTQKDDMLHYIVLSPYDYQNGRYIFGPENLLREYFWHEIGHTKINDLTRKYINLIKPDEKELPDSLIKHGYTDIETIINEYVIRAITARFFEIESETNFIEYYVKTNIKKGFTEIEKIKDYIKKNNEDKNKRVFIRNLVFEINQKIPLDILVYSKEELKKIKEYGNFFIDEIERTGKIIYEKVG